MQDALIYVNEAERGGGGVSGSKAARRRRRLRLPAQPWTAVECPWAFASTCGQARARRRRAHLPNAPCRPSGTRWIWSRQA